MKPSYKTFLSSKPIYYSTWAFIVLCILTCACTGVKHTFIETLRFLSWCMIAEILIRIAQVGEYDINLTVGDSISTKIVSQIWSFNKASLATIVVVVILIVGLDMTNTFMNFSQTMPMMCGYIFIRAIHFNESTYMKGLWIENSSGLDYGSGMAYSFFYGYLNIILPNKGDQNFNIKELMNIYEDTEDIKFGEKRLFLLIPRSLYCPPDLCDVSKGPKVHMEAAKNLESMERHRAGVKSRVYKNSVYKIHVQNQNSPVYIAAESATPLLTLYESIKSDGVHQKHYRENSDEIVLQFYKTLKHLIKTNIECKNVCELVFYDDVTEDVNVGEILLQRIKDLKKR